MMRPASMTVCDVGLHGCGEAMSDDQHRVTFGEGQEAAQPVGFGPRVHGAGGFIQNQDIWLAEKSPCQSQSLPFSYAQVDAAEPAPSKVS
jgi:hypothetical protein